MCLLSSLVFTGASLWDIPVVLPRELGKGGNGGGGEPPFVFGFDDTDAGVPSNEVDEEDPSMTADLGLLLAYPLNVPLPIEAPAVEGRGGNFFTLALLEPGRSGDDFLCSGTG